MFQSATCLSGCGGRLSPPSPSSLGLPASPHWQAGPGTGLSMMAFLTGCRLMSSLKSCKLTRSLIKTLFFQALLRSPHPHGYVLPQEGHAAQQAQLLADLCQVRLSKDCLLEFSHFMPLFLSGRTSRAMAPSTGATTSTTSTEACPVCPLS